MDTQLTTTPSPLLLFPTQGLSKTETTLTLHCHDRVFENADILDTTTGTKLFTTTTKPFKSYSWRRTIRSAPSNTHLFDLRIVTDGDNVLRHKWIIEREDGTEIFCIRHTSLTKRLMLDVVVRSEDAKVKEKDVVASLKPVDSAGLTTLIMVDGEVVAEIRMVESNPKLNGRDRSVWNARVAKGVDLALVAAIMLCRAETAHVHEN